jgi:hypothetical protein
VRGPPSGGLFANWNYTPQLFRTRDKNRQEREKTIFEIDYATNAQDLPQDPHRFFLHQKGEEDK